MMHFNLTTISSGEDRSPSRFASLPAGLSNLLLLSFFFGGGGGKLGRWGWKYAISQKVNPKYFQNISLAFNLLLLRRKIWKYLLTFLRLINCCLVRIARQEADETQREETANFLCFLQGLDFDFEYFIEQNKFKRKKLYFFFQGPRHPFSSFSYSQQVDKFQFFFYQRCSLSQPPCFREK